MNALPVYSFGGGAKYPNNDERKKERKQGIAFSFTKNKVKQCSYCAWHQYPIPLT